MRLTKEQLEFIEAHRDEDVGKLALLFGGKGRKGDCTLEGEELRFALMQVEARQRLREKLPTILEKREFVFPTRISTEQASSEVTAELKGKIIESLDNPEKPETPDNPENPENPENPDYPASQRISADLTGGLGIDTIYLAKGSKRHHYVEINPEHSAAADVNMPLFSDNIVVHNTDAESFLKETDERFDFVYADPARRSESNSKVFRLEDCVPNILELKPLIMSKSRWLIVKLSPMLDVTQAINKLGAEKVIVVSVNDECKELIVVCGHNDCKRCVIEAVEINKRGLFIENPDNPGHPENPENPDLYGVPVAGDYLYEPYAAMMKAGMYKELAVKYGMKMLAPSSHLYFAERNSRFPGREFVVREVSVFTKNSIKGIRKANITVRNFPMSVAEVRKRFGIAEGGENYLFLTTDSQGEKLMIRCEKIS